MIRIELDEPTLARTRIAISPLWEAVTSLYLLWRNPEAPWPYTGWARHARRALAELPATAPLRVYADSGGRVPGGVPRTFTERVAVRHRTATLSVNQRRPSAPYDDCHSPCCHAGRPGIRRARVRTR